MVCRIQIIQVLMHADTWDSSPLWTKQNSYVDAEDLLFCVLRPHYVHCSFTSPGGIKSQQELQSLCLAKHGLQSWITAPQDRLGHPVCHREYKELIYLKALLFAQEIMHGVVKSGYLVFFHFLLQSLFFMMVQQYMVKTDSFLDWVKCCWIVQVLFYLYYR